MRITLRLAAILAAAALAGACGDDGGEPTPDAMTQDNPDAPTTPDAPPAAACDATGDFTEADEAGNAATAEATGQSVTLEDSFTIAGCIDPRQATADLADADLFGFTLGGTEPSWLTLDLASPEDAAADGTVAVILDPTLMNQFGFAEFENGTAIMAPTRLDPGEYVLAVLNEDTALTDAHGYVITVSAVQCTSRAGETADYTEANDGAENTGNDIALIAYPESGTTVTLTDDPDDVPEATGLTMAANMSYLITGNTANVTPPADEYIDRDTFAFTTGADVDRAAILLEWNDTTEDPDMDMDWWLFPADDVTIDSVVAISFFISPVDEAGGAVIQPDTTYWLWTGLYNDEPTISAEGEDYTITVCTY